MDWENKYGHIEDKDLTQALRIDGRTGTESSLDGVRKRGTI